MSRTDRYQVDLWRNLNFSFVATAYCCHILMSSLGDRWYAQVRLTAHSRQMKRCKRSAYGCMPSAAAKPEYTSTNGRKACIAYGVNAVTAAGGNFGNIPLTTQGTNLTVPVIQRGSNDGSRNTGNRRTALPRPFCA